MHVEQRKDKNGNLISYRLICSGKDTYSGKHKNYSRTFKITPDLTTKKEIDHALHKAMFDFEEEVARLSAGVRTIENKILFEDFAEQWLNNILVRSPNSYSYYNDAKNHLKVIIPFFKGYQLKNIGPNLVQDFYDSLSAKTYDKQIVIVKKSIKELIDTSNLFQHEIADQIGINRLTLRVATNVGNQVSMTTAKAICKYFNVPLNKYFEITINKTRYSKATIAGIRTALVMILSEAKRRMLIDHNYATKEYTKKLTGDVKKKIVFSEDEAKRFVQCVLEETDLRKKAILTILIMLGLRKGEIAGLCASDIDFANNTLSVNRNCIYAGKEFGIKVKSPKTKTSKRTLFMPKILESVLHEYIEWWQEQKRLHGDLWENTDFLFLQDNGKIINPCTLGQWVTKFEIKHGFEHVPCHSIRHSATTLMIRSGIPIKVVSQILGHTSEAFTLQVYAHVLQGQQEQASKTYNDFLCS